MIADTPFPHVIMDNLFDLELCRRARAEFDLVTDWQEYRNPTERKLAAEFDRCPGPAVATIRNVLQGAPFRCLLEGLFDIPDLSFDGLGGGLHRILQSGHLDVHVDFNVHPDGRYRRLNVLVFLNDQPDRSADLWLCAAPDDRHPVRIAPIMGRVVAFQTGEQSWHGHPVPLLGQERRSLAAYYYTEDAPVDVAPPHDTIYPAAVT